MSSFHGWDSTPSRLEPLREDNLLFTTKFPEIPGAHFIDLGRKKSRLFLFDRSKNNGATDVKMDGSVLEEIIFYDAGVGFLF